MILKHHSLLYSIAFVAIALCFTQKSFAENLPSEPLSVRFKGVYSVSKSWIITVSENDMQIIPANSLIDNGVTVITAESYPAFQGELTAVLTTDTEEIVASTLEDAAAASFETRSGAEDILMQRSRSELLTKTSEDLDTMITVERARLAAPFEEQKK